MKNKRTRAQKKRIKRAKAKRVKAGRVKSEFSTGPIKIMGVVALIFLGIGLYSKIVKARKLNDCSKRTEAQIYRVTNASGTHHNYYVFYIDNIRYDNGFISSKNLKIGDQVKIRYYCSDYSVSEELERY